MWLIVTLGIIVALVLAAAAYDVRQKRRGRYHRISVGSGPRVAQATKGETVNPTGGPGATNGGGLPS